MQQSKQHQLILIAAMTPSRVIGNGATMPWYLPEEYQQYLDFVEGSTVIMGRKTYEVFGGDLPSSSPAIVLSRSWTTDSAIVARSLDEALRRATGRTESGAGPSRIFVAGGSSVYEQALPLADKMYLSTLRQDYSGDAYFPRFAPQDWETYHETIRPEYTFRKYRRIQPAGSDGTAHTQRVSR